MAKPPTPDIASLGVRERIVLFCVASGTDWQRAGIPGETVTALVVRGLLVRGGRWRLALTDSGRTVLRALLPGLQRVKTVEVVQVGITPARRRAIEG